MTSVILFFIAILVGAFGGIMLKIGSGHLISFSFSWEFLFNFLSNYRLLIGIALYIIPTIIWIYLLTKFPLSYIQPMLALTYAITPLLAWFILSEPVSILRWVGIAIVIVGVIIISRS